jgi:hypothetical protein
MLGQVQSTLKTNNARIVKTADDCQTADRCCQNGGSLL